MARYWHRRSIQDNNQQPVEFFKKKSSAQEAYWTPKPFFNNGQVQTKLAVNEPGDAYEKEADSMADTVVQKLGENGGANNGNSMPSIQRQPDMFFRRKCDDCEKEDKIQKKPAPVLKMNQDAVLQRQPAKPKEKAPGRAAEPPPPR